MLKNVVEILPDYVEAEKQNAATFAKRAVVNDFLVYAQILNF